MQFRSSKITFYSCFDHIIIIVVPPQDNIEARLLSDLLENCRLDVDQFKVWKKDRSKTIQNKTLTENGILKVTKIYFTI